MSVDTPEGAGRAKGNFERLIPIPYRLKLIRRIDVVPPARCWTWNSAWMIPSSSSDSDGGSENGETGPFGFGPDAGLIEPRAHKASRIRPNNVQVGQPRGRN